MKFQLFAIMGLLALVLLLSCQDNEFIPQPEGEKVPYEEVTTTLDEVLETSGYSIFRTLWDGSRMDSILATQGKAQFTFLVPDNRAFEAAGLTASVAAEMPVADKDSLLSNHVLIGNLNVAMETGILPVSGYQTLLRHPFYEESMSDGSVISYTYKHYLGISGDDLFIDGKNEGIYQYKEIINGGVPRQPDANTSQTNAERSIGKG